MGSLDMDKFCGSAFWVSALEILYLAQLKYAKYAQSLYTVLFNINLDASILLIICMYGNML